MSIISGDEKKLVFSLPGRVQLPSQQLAIPPWWLVTESVQSVNLFEYVTLFIDYIFTENCHTASQI